MAKLYFLKGQKNVEGLAGGFLNDTQWDATKPSSHKSLYDILDCSDSDYNNLYKGKKVVVVNDDESITAADLPTAQTITTELSFRNGIEKYIKRLEEFKKLYSSHPKISEVNDSLDYALAIDYSSITFPSKEAERYLADNNKYINISLI